MSMYISSKRGESVIFPFWDQCQGCQVGVKCKEFSHRLLLTSVTNWRSRLGWVLLLRTWSNNRRGQDVAQNGNPN